MSNSKIDLEKSKKEFEDIYKKQDLKRLAVALGSESLLWNKKIFLPTELQQEAEGKDILSRLYRISPLAFKNECKIHTMHQESAVKNKGSKDALFYLSLARSNQLERIRLFFYANYAEPSAIVKIINPEVIVGYIESALAKQENILNPDDKKYPLGRITYSLEKNTPVKNTLSPESKEEFRRLGNLILNHALKLEKTAMKSLVPALFDESVIYGRPTDSLIDVINSTNSDMAHIRRYISATNANGTNVPNTAEQSKEFEKIYLSRNLSFFATDLGDGYGLNDVAGNAVGKEILESLYKKSKSVFDEECIKYSRSAGQPYDIQAAKERIQKHLEATSKAQTVAGISPKDASGHNSQSFHSQRVNTAKTAGVQAKL